jgi:ubiquinone/menaquinone biosynthesis C-methylase UbiE
MERFRGPDDIRAAYQDDRVARQYISERFTQPLGELLHDRQARAVSAAIQAHRPERVLEIAPGPARLTVDVARGFTGCGFLIDASGEMLAEARRRLEPIAPNRWSYVRGDVFNLPFDFQFDLVYSFRLIRHFQLEDRLKIYEQIRNVIRPKGVLIFDAVNELVSAPLRQNAPEEYQHYDALLRPEALHDELRRSGFDVLDIAGVQRRYSILRNLQILVAPRSRALARLSMEIVDRCGGEPLEWIVTCRRA